MALMSMITYLTSALVAAALVCPVPGQNQGRAQPRPTPPPSQGAKPAPQAPVRTQATQQQREQIRARETEWARRQQQDPNFAARWQTASRNMLRYEHEHRLRVARLDRIEDVYRAAGNTERIRAVEQLRQRLTTRHQERMQECRDALGDGDYDRIRERIAEHDRLRLQDRDRDRDRLGQPEPPKGGVR